MRKIYVCQSSVVYRILFVSAAGRTVSPIEDDCLHFGAGGIYSILYSYLYAVLFFPSVKLMHVNRNHIICHNFCVFTAANGYLQHRPMARIGEMKHIFDLCILCPSTFFSSNLVYSYGSIVYFVWKWFICLKNNKNIKIKNWNIRPSMLIYLIIVYFPYD